MTKEQLDKGNELKVKIMQQQHKIDELSAINTNINNLEKLKIQAVYNDTCKSYGEYFLGEYFLNDKNIAEQILAILSSHENEKLLKLEDEFKAL